MHNSNKKGFTLIELLVVIAIIGILSSIGLVALNGARAKARDAKRLSDAATIGLAYESYYDSLTPNTYVSTCAQASVVGDCSPLKAAVQSGLLPKDPSSTTAMAAAAACATKGDTDCLLGANWTCAGGTCAYTLAFESTTDFGVGVMIEEGTGGVTSGPKVRNSAGLFQ